MSVSFVPNTFNVPTSLTTEAFHFIELTTAVAEQDYQAVMSSQQSLVGIFGPDFSWPKADMSYQENYDSLKVHEQEFIDREAFAYSVFNAEKDKCLGSVYIDSSRSKDYDGEVYFWLRDDCASLEPLLEQNLVHWLETQWPFTRLVYPGRSISWPKWQAHLTANK